MALQEMLQLARLILEVGKQCQLHLRLAVAPADGRPYRIQIVRVILKTGRNGTSRMEGDAATTHKAMNGRL